MRAPMYKPARGDIVSVEVDANDGVQISYCLRSVEWDESGNLR